MGIHDYLALIHKFGDLAKLTIELKSPYFNLHYFVNFLPEPLERRKHFYPTSSTVKKSETLFTILLRDVKTCPGRKFNSSQYFVQQLKQNMWNTLVFQ